MNVRSLSGKVLFEGRFLSFKEMIEEAVRNHIDLSGANLRGVNLSHANLRGVTLEHACLWGANLNHTDLISTNFKFADCRLIQCDQADFTQANCSNADFSGAKFNQTILDQTDFTAAHFSHPSFWEQKLENIHSLNRAIYHHQGEEAWDLSFFLPQLQKAIHNCEYNKINKLKGEIRRTRNFTTQKA